MSEKSISDLLLSIDGVVPVAGPTYSAPIGPNNEPCGIYEVTAGKWNCEHKNRISETTGFGHITHEVCADCGHRFV